MEKLQKQSSAFNQGLDTENEESIIHTHFNYKKQYRVRVSAKLKDNKCQRMLLKVQRDKQNQQVLKRRAQKNNKVMIAVKSKLTEVEQKAHALSNKHVIPKDQSIEKIFLEERENELINKIAMKRQKVQKIKEQYSGKIRQKFASDYDRVKKNHTEIQKKYQDKLDVHHLKEWKQYERNILKKRSPNNKYNEQDNLYYRYKNKNAKTLEFIKKFQSSEKNLQQNEKILSNIEEKPTTAETIGSISRKNASYKIKSLLEFGLCSQIINFQTFLPKTKDFLQKNRQTKNIDKQQDLLQKFQEFLQSYS